MKCIVVQIWDTAGQERFKSLRTPFYRGTDICLLTYAVDDKTSFNNLKLWMEEFKSYADVTGSNENFPFIVVGNKVNIYVFQFSVCNSFSLIFCLFLSLIRLLEK